MKLPEFAPFEHYCSGSQLYLMADVGTDYVVLMKVEEYKEGVERKFKKYLKEDFFLLMNDQGKFEKCVPIVPPKK